MNPLLLSALMSFAPGLLSHLFGGDPAAEYRKRAAALTSPNNQSRLTNQFFQQALGSPAYSQAQGTIAAGANATAGQLASRLGASGIGSSGTGALLSSLTPSIVGGQQAGLRTGAYQAAQGQAQSSIEAQLKALAGTYGQASPTQQYFAGGLEAFGPMIQAWLKSRYPQLSGGQVAGGNNQYMPTPDMPYLPAGVH